MTKLPSLSVLLAPQGHFGFQAPPCNNSSYAALQHRPEVMLPLHYYAHPEHQQQQEEQFYQQQQPQQHYQQLQQQQQQPSYKYESAPGSPSSPSCWEPTFASVSRQPPSPPPYYYSNSQYQQQQPAAMAYHSEYFSSSSEDESSSVHSVSSAAALSANGVLQASSATSKATSSASVRPKKTSRYLREMDRRAIIKRLDDGEKQCALAKEFNVSRSSICNLFKHREEVLLRAHHQSPFSKHPKKKCNKRRQSQMLLHSLHHTSAAAMVPTHSTSGMRV